jgi:hypothetical protein
MLPKPAWEVEYTDEFEVWWNDLSEDEQESIVAAVEFLEERGPALGRPFVDTIKSSRHHNMKELIPPGGHIRYEEMVPMADELYDKHLEQLRQEGWIR